MIPYLKRQPSLFVICLIVVLFPTLYFWSQSLLKPNHIAVAQLVFFFIPAIFFIKQFEISRAFVTKNLMTNVALVILASLILTVTLNTLLTFWLELFPIPESYEKMYEDMLSQHTKFGLYLDMVKIAMVPALCEEFFFRGLLQTSLSTTIQKHHAILVTALIFALYHLNPWYAPFFFILGAFFGYIYFYKNNLWLAVLAHFINNAYGVIMYHNLGG